MFSYLFVKIEASQSARFFNEGDLYDEYNTYCAQDLTLLAAFDCAHGSRIHVYSVEPRTVPSYALYGLFVQKSPFC